MSFDRCYCFLFDVIEFQSTEYLCYWNLKRTIEDTIHTRAKGSGQKVYNQRGINNVTLSFWYSQTLSPAN